MSTLTFHKEVGEQVHRSMDLALKSARVADFCKTLSGLADVKNTADRRLAENFVPDSRLFLSGSSDRRY